MGVKIRYINISDFEVKGEKIIIKRSFLYKKRVPRSHRNCIIRDEKYEIPINDIDIVFDPFILERNCLKTSGTILEKMVNSNDLSAYSTKDKVKAIDDYIKHVSPAKEGGVYEKSPGDIYLVTNDAIYSIRNS